VVGSLASCLPEPNICRLASTPSPGLTADEKKTLLDLTNAYRCQHGAPALAWNDALAASTYDFFKGMSMRTAQHSNSYGLTNAQGGPAGENLAMGSPSVSAARSVTMWYDEVKDCGPFPGCSDGKKGVVGHFTALVWKGTTVMGCAKSIDSQVIACRYGNGPGSALSCNSPNMGGCYNANVLAATKTAAQCGASPSPPAAVPSPPAAVPSPPAAVPSPPAAVPSPPAAVPSPPAAVPAAVGTSTVTNTEADGSVVTTTTTVSKTANGCTKTQIKVTRVNKLGTSSSTSTRSSTVCGAGR
jgi:hypothetical protein